MNKNRLRKKLSVLKIEGKLQGTIKSAMARHEERASRKQTQDTLSLPVSERLLRRSTLVPLGPESIRYTEEYNQKKYPRRRNWLDPRPIKTRHTLSCDEIDNGEYSSRCTFHYWTYIPIVTSSALIINSGQTIIWNFALNTPTHLKAPRGYHWDVDNNGLRLVANRNNDIDYHVNSDDLNNYDGHDLARKARENHKIRVEERKKARADKKAILTAEKEGCMVCAKDSIKAGNCKYGTISFAKRHHLDPAKHYKPSDLLDIMNGDAPRVRLAVAVALRRHKQEVARGYALLEDHTI
jgi:hypothetical protein